MLRHATDNFLFIIYQRFYKIQLDAHTEGYNTLRAGEGFLTTKYQTFTDFFDIKRKNTQSSIDDFYRKDALGTNYYTFNGAYLIQIILKLMDKKIGIFF